MTGDVVYLKAEKRHVFYLITKKCYNNKPLYSDLEKSLKKLLELCKKLSIKQLAMPYIGAGLDMLDWRLVSRIIDATFDMHSIDLTIYKYEAPPTPKEKDIEPSGPQKRKRI